MYNFYYLKKLLLCFNWYYEVEDSCNKESENKGQG